MFEVATRLFTPPVSYAQVSRVVVVNDRRTGSDKSSLHYQEKPDKNNGRYKVAGVSPADYLRHNEWRRVYERCWKDAGPFSRFNAQTVVEL